MISCVYLIYNKINGKIYVGKSNELESRWTRHLRVARGGKTMYPTTFSWIHAAICKYGSDNFIFKIIEILPTEEVALSKEIEWISLLRSAGYKLYNLTEGGDGSSGYKHTAESIAKMTGSNNAFYGKTHSDELKLNHSKRMSGSGNPRFGKKAKPEHLEKMSKNRIGKAAGSNHPGAKFTELQIRTIREEYLIVKSLEFFAKQYNVTTKTIWNIVNRKTYKNVI